MYPYPPIGPINVKWSFSFQLASCQLDALQQYNDNSSVREALRSLQGTMDKVYDRIILKMDEEYPGHIQAILQWLAYCQDEPSITQLAEVVLIDHGREIPTFDESRRISPQRPTDLCSDLIYIKTVEADGWYADTATTTQVCFLPLSLKMCLLFAFISQNVSPV